MDSVTQNLMNDLASAQTQMRHIAQQHETGDKEIQSQADDAIPKKLKYLRKCIDDKLNEMERQLLWNAQFQGQKESISVMRLEDGINTCNLLQSQVSFLIKLKNMDQTSIYTITLQQTVCRRS